jgi:hypothetical protein
MAGGVGGSGATEVLLMVTSPSEVVTVTVGPPVATVPCSTWLPF